MKLDAALEQNAWSSLESWTSLMFLKTKVGEVVPLSPEFRLREVRPSFLGEERSWARPAIVPGKSSLRRGVSEGDSPSYSPRSSIF